MRPERLLSLCLESTGWGQGGAEHITACLWLWVLVGSSPLTDWEWNTSPLLWLNLQDPVPMPLLLESSLKLSLIVRFSVHTSSLVHHYAT